MSRVPHVLALATLAVTTACVESASPEAASTDELASTTPAPVWKRQLVCRNPAAGGRYDALVIDADPSIRLPGGYSPYQAVIRDDMVIGWFESHGLVTRNLPYNFHEAIIPGEGYTGAGIVGFQDERPDGIWVDVGQIGGAWDRIRVRFFHYDPGSQCPSYCYDSWNSSPSCEGCTPPQITDIADWIFDQCRYD